MLSLRRAPALLLAVLLVAATLQADTPRATTQGSDGVTPAQAFGDLNGDGNDDVLLRHTDGRWYYYPMNGRHVLPSGRGGGYITRSLDWQFAGLGDLNGDGNDDVLLRRTTDGRWYYYPMDGRRTLTDQRGGANIVSDLNWQLAGIGDLNGDGKDDVLMRHTDGRWYYYPMNGRHQIRAERGTANLTTDPDWQLAGLGDLNGDGRDDVLLRHTDGRWYYYPMNGREPLTEGRGPAYVTASLNWQFAGLGDLNGDGNDDVLLRRSTDGGWYYYPMNGRRTLDDQRGSAAIVSDLNWQLAGMGDLNGDGRDDVLLRHNGDNRWLYYPMNGRRHISTGRGIAYLTTDADWGVAGTGGSGSTGGTGGNGDSGGSDGSDGNGGTGDSDGNGGNGDTGSDGGSDGTDSSDGTGGTGGTGGNGGTGGSGGDADGAPVGNDDHSDARSGASGLSPGGSVTGQIDPGGDVDYFFVQVNGPGTLTLYTTGSLDTLGELQDSAGTKLAEHDDTDVNTNRNFRIEHTVSAGSYYVKVESYRTNTGDYTLHAEFSGSDSNDSNDDDGNTGDSGDTGGNGGSDPTTPVDDLLLPEMAPIPGGTFRMGGLEIEENGQSYCENQNNRSSRCPVHPVTVQPFKMGKYEVTFAQWDACVADGGCPPGERDYGGWGRGNRPIINVELYSVQSYIDWLNSKTGGGYRLPSEAEWEYAARAGSTTRYSWGNDMGSNRANCLNRNPTNPADNTNPCGDQWEYTAPVGSFPANAWGLHDMHGNVAEWTQDCWNDSYVGAPSDGSAWLTGDCNDRAIRGGSWGGYASNLTSSIRSRGWVGGYGDGLGFRVAQDD